MKKLGWSVAALFVALLACFFLFAPGLVESTLNRVDSSHALPVSAQAEQLHASLRIADLHADSLLWGRDLLRRGTRGQADVPRLIDGNVALQVFTAVTKSPRGLNYERNDSNSDTIIWLAIAQRWPPRTWTSLTQRALYLAGRFHRMAADSRGKLVPIGNVRDLEAYLERRQTDPRITAGILGIEGAHALDGKLENLDVVYDAGYRYISLTHFFDDAFAGSSAGVNKGGLTPLGRQLVQKMNQKHVIIDLAHTSSDTMRDVLSLTSRPVLYSHGGLKGTCNNNRNLSDAEALTIARNGGIIGIGYWPTAVCGSDVASIVRSIRYAVSLVGIEHVALGSDFDGSVTVPFDAAHLDELTQGLLQAGFSRDDIRSVMGENAIRFFHDNLPQ